MTQFSDDLKFSDLPDRISIFPLSGVLLLPSTQIPLHVFEPRYVELVDQALRTNRLIGIIQPELTKTSNSDKPQICDVGCLGQLTSWQVVGENRYHITVAGVIRFAVAREIAVDTPYRQVDVDFSLFAGDLDDPKEEIELDREKLLTKLQFFMSDQDLDFEWEAMHQAPNAVIVDAFSAICPFEPAEQQALLEAKTAEERASILLTLIDIATATEISSIEESLH